MIVEVGKVWDGGEGLALMFVPIRNFRDIDCSKVVVLMGIFHVKVI